VLELKTVFYAASAPRSEKPGCRDNNDDGDARGGG
jgi:hypothetical protein